LNRLLKILVRKVPLGGHRANKDMLFHLQTPRHLAEKRRVFVWVMWVICSTRVCYSKSRLLKF